MRIEEYTFVVKQKQEGFSWAEITENFNKFFESDLTEEAVKNRYKREQKFRRSIENIDVLDKALELIKHSPMKPTELAKQLSLDMDGLEALLDDIINNRSAVKFCNNYLIFDADAPSPENKKLTLSDWLDNKESVKIGIIADTHCCSIYECSEQLHMYYDICAKENISAILHAGDLYAGGGTVYKGQYQELKIIGVDKQKDYVISTYPNVGIPTFIISGNHDLDYYKTAGIDIVAQTCDARDDFTYLGQLAGYLDLSGISFYLAHGEGGVPYSRSYKPQKLLEGFDKNTLPDVATWGHWHITEHMPKYKGVISICPGCFERQTPYLKRKGLFPDIGGIILEMALLDTPMGKKIGRHKCEFIDMSFI